MSSHPNSPRLVKGGLVILDTVSGALKRTIAVQYNPDQQQGTDHGYGVGQD